MTKIRYTNGNDTDELVRLLIYLLRNMEWERTQQKAYDPYTESLEYDDIVICMIDGFIHVTIESIEFKMISSKVDHRLYEAFSEAIDNHDRRLAESIKNDREHKISQAVKYLESLKCQTKLISPEGI